jgi:hypothetical protein
MNDEILPITMLISFGGTLLQQCFEKDIPQTIEVNSDTPSTGPIWSPEVNGSQTYIAPFNMNNYVSTSQYDPSYFYIVPMMSLSFGIGANAPNIAPDGTTTGPVPTFFISLYTGVPYTSLSLEGTATASITMNTSSAQNNSCAIQGWNTISPFVYNMATQFITSKLYYCLKINQTDSNLSFTAFATNTFVPQAGQIMLLVSSNNFNAV